MISLPGSDRRKDERTNGRNRERAREGGRKERRRTGGRTFRVLSWGVERVRQGNDGYLFTNVYIYIPSSKVKQSKRSGKGRDASILANTITLHPVCLSVFSRPAPPVFCPCYAIFSPGAELSKPTTPTLPPPAPAPPLPPRRNAPNLSRNSNVSLNAHLANPTPPAALPIPLHPPPTTTPTPDPQPPLQQAITLLRLNALIPRPNRNMRNLIRRPPLPHPRLFSRRRRR